MNKNWLIKKISEHKSIREISKESNKSYSTVRYWLRKYNLKTNVIKGKPKKTLCHKCGETHPSKFYEKRKSKCRACHNQDTINKGLANKQFAVDLKGGSCQVCGYKKSIWALQFHHTDPKIKDKDWKGMRGWSQPRLEKELGKCILLCSNCHSEEHERLSMAKS